MKVLVGSLNPVKINATREAFKNYFENVEVIGCSVPSQVPDQPINEQTYVGAQNRALALQNYAATNHPDAEFFVGIEGGIEQTNNTWYSFGVMHILNKDGRSGVGKSPHFILPSSVVEQLLQGKELGHVMDHHMDEENIKQKSGTIGVLTNNVISRTDLYVQGIIMALVPFLNKEFYFATNSTA